MFYLIQKKEAKYLKGIISSAKNIAQFRDGNKVDEENKPKISLNIAKNLEISLPSAVSFENKKQMSMLSLPSINKIYPE